MENIIKEVTGTEIPAPPTPPVEPQGGFPWCGTGIVVAVIVAAAVCAKLYQCTSKKK